MKKTEKGNYSELGGQKKKKREIIEWRKITN